ncbi:MAG: hypothetical protein ACFFFO_00775, partial [Candidatus Thorarchaeota archaeon]
MKFVRTGKYREDTLERSVEINSLDEARGRFKRMNYLLGFVKVQKPEDFPEYVLNLISKYDSLLKDERKISNPLDLDELVSDNPNLKEHLELAIVVLNYFRQILQLPTESKLGKIEVVNRNYFRSFSHISYPNLLVLTETIGRDEAISLYKRFVTHYTLENRDPNRETIDDLETLFAKRTEPKEVPS